MNNNETLDKMKTMRLQGMHRAFKTSLENGKTETFTPDEMTAYLVTN